MARPQARTGSVVGIALAAALGLGSDALASRFFSHEAHVWYREDKPCTICHDLRRDRPGEGPAKATCTGCHDDGPPQRKPSVPHRKLTLKFPHERHERAAQCGACHADTAEDRRIGQRRFVEPEACVSCHRAKYPGMQAAGCAPCHGSDIRARRPADHGVGWSRSHGLEASRFGFEGHAKDCTACHARSACVACHQSVRPASHTGLWALRGHGLAASWEPERCRTCHESGTCVRCHASTRPLNHGGAWRATHGLAARTQTNATCATCHRPGWCAQCHHKR